MKRALLVVALAACGKSASEPPPPPKPVAPPHQTIRVAVIGAFREVLAARSGSDRSIHR